LLLSGPAQLMLAPRLLNGLGFTRGQPMNISVPVLGHPLPDITWIKDGDVLKPSDRCQLVVEDGSAMLSVSACDRLKDGGQYSLRIMNCLGTDQATFLVIIFGKF